MLPWVLELEANRKNTLTPPKSQSARQLNAGCLTSARPHIAALLVYSHAQPSNWQDAAVSGRVPPSGRVRLPINWGIPLTKVTPIGSVRVRGGLSSDPGGVRAP